MSLIPPTECKLIIKIKPVGVVIEGNVPNIDVARLMLCSAISEIEKMFLDRQGGKIVTPDGLRIAQ